MASVKSVLTNIWQLKPWIVLVIAILAPLYLVIEINSKVRCKFFSFYFI